MPTKREREYYRMGFSDGMKAIQAPEKDLRRELFGEEYVDFSIEKPRKKKRKLSAWNKYIKANSKKPRFRLRSGSPNLKKLAVAFRKTPAGRKKKRR